MSRSIVVATTMIIACCGVTKAQAQVFSAVGEYTTNASEFGDWMNAATGAGAVGIVTENFDSFNGMAGDPNIDISPGTSFLTPSGMSIFFDESSDASAASRAQIDRVSTGWTNDPPFEGTAAFEAFPIVPAGTGSGSNIIRFDFPTPVIGFAADFDSATSGGDVVLIIDGVTVVNLETFLPDGSDGFLGFVNDTPFTSLEFGAVNTAFAGEVFDLDNATWAVVPEPGSFGVLMIAALAIIRRRR